LLKKKSESLLSGKRAGEEKISDKSKTPSNVSFELVREKVNNMEEQELEELLKDIQLVLTCDIINTHAEISNLPLADTTTNPIFQKVGEQLKASLLARFNAVKASL
jgi:hypothetical protein